MNTETPTTPTIAELWGKLKFRDDRFARKHLEELDGVDFDALRAQLIERCEKVKDTLGNYDSFTTGHDAECRPLIDVEHRGHDREDSPETAREMSAAYAFWAWELEQRQKESQEAPI